MKSWLAIAILPCLYSQPASPLGTGASVARGDKLFAQGCAVGYCHGASGSAARSPRLRGRTFDREYLIRVISNGIPNTAMPAWGDRLTDADIADLTDYIQSLSDAPADIPAVAPADTPAPTAPDKPTETPDEHARGRELFFDLSRESRCSVCHRLNGNGTPAGLDVTKVASLSVEDGARVLRYGRPRTVRTIALTDGSRFPGVVVERTAASLRVYDLTAVPPVLRTLAGTEVQMVLRQSQWRHGTVVRAYTSEEMQLIWNYVRFVAGKK